MAIDLQRTLERNDKYLQQVVEGYNLCPFARQCRLSDKLHREVIASQDIAAALLARLLQLQQTDDTSFEVALVIVPGFAGSTHQFETLLRQVEAQIVAYLAGMGQRQACFAVAFHPQMPFETGQPHQIVGLLRRSPDPTVQLVRRSLLEQVRGNDSAPQYLDTQPHATAESLLAAAAALVIRPTLSERIAAANFQTWHRTGQALAAATAEIAADRDAD